MLQITSLKINNIMNLRKNWMVLRSSLGPDIKKFHIITFRHNTALVFLLFLCLWGPKNVPCPFFPNLFDFRCLDLIALFTLFLNLELQLTFLHLNCTEIFIPLNFFFSAWYQKLNSWLNTCKAGAMPLSYIPGPL